MTRRNYEWACKRKSVQRRISKASFRWQKALSAWRDVGYSETVIQRKSEILKSAVARRTVDDEKLNNEASKIDAAIKLLKKKLCTVIVDVKMDDSLAEGSAKNIYTVWAFAMPRPAARPVGYSSYDRVRVHAQLFYHWYDQFVTHFLKFELLLFYFWFDF